MLTINELFVLTILAIVGKCLTSLQISNRTAIPQPDVVSALQSLKNQGLVQECDNNSSPGMEDATITEVDRDPNSGMEDATITEVDRDPNSDMIPAQIIPIVNTWCITKKGEKHIEQLNSEMDDS